MQQLLSIILVLVMYLTVIPSSGPVEVDSGWMEVTEGTVLTVRLPANPTTGYEWSIFISDPDVLELLTEEYTPDPGSEELTGAGGTWAASFRGLSAGTATLTLTYAASYDETLIADRRKIKVSVAEDLSLTTFTSPEPMVEEVWYELTEDLTVLTVRLPANETTGYAWEFASNPDLIELITTEYVEDAGSDVMVGRGGTWVASFRGIPGMSGLTDLTLTYKRDWETEGVETRTLTIFVSENGELEIQVISIHEQ